MSAPLDPHVHPYHPQICAAEGITGNQIVQDAAMYALKIILKAFKFKKKKKGIWNTFYFIIFVYIFLDTTLSIHSSAGMPRSSVSKLFAGFLAHLLVIFI